MQFRIEFRIGRLDTEQVTRRARLPPAAVGLGRLFSERERDSRLMIRLCADFTHNAFNKFRELVRHHLSRLQNERRKTVTVCPQCGFNDFLSGNLKPLHIPVSAADTAVITVFPADVADLDQAADAYFLPDVFQFHLIGVVIKTAKLAGISQAEQSFEFMIGHGAPPSKYYRNSREI